MKEKSREITHFVVQTSSIRLCAVDLYKNLLSRRKFHYRYVASKASRSVPITGIDNSQFLFSVVMEDISFKRNISARFKSKMENISPGCMAGKVPIVITVLSSFVIDNMVEY